MGGGGGGGGERGGKVEKGGWVAVALWEASLYLLYHLRFAQLPEALREHEHCC